MNNYIWKSISLLVILGFSLTGRPTSVQAATTNVLIKNFTYIPKVVTINVGDTVTWEQQDSMPHTATDDNNPPNWDSGLLSMGQTFSHTFTTAGTFPYYCIPHRSNPNMHATVIVQEAPPPTNAVLEIMSITNQPLAVTLEWMGGAGPFELQQKTSLADSNWISVLTTTNHSETVPKAGDVGIYRVMDQATNNARPFTVLLSAANEIPTNSSPGTGIGILSLSGSNLTYHITFSGLSASASAAHIHAPADPTNNASVMVPFDGVSGTSGVISGVEALTENQVSNLVAGKSYVNIHTPNNPGGEIRGQVVPLRIPVSLSGDAEIPPVTTSGAGAGQVTLIGSQFFYNVPFTGLSTDATMAHVHGPASLTNSAPVLFPLEGAVGTSGRLSGTHLLTPDQLTLLLNGSTYINIHTSQNPPGEIRGQIIPAK